MASPAVGSTGCARWRTADLPPDAADAGAADATPAPSTKAAAIIHPSVSLLMFDENACRRDSEKTVRKSTKSGWTCSHYQLLGLRNQPEE
jgi:hypothetical protein